MRRVILGILFFLVSTPAWATITRVQSKAKFSGSGTTCLVTFTSNPAQNDLIVVWTFWQPTSATASVSDTLLNSYGSAVGPTTQPGTPGGLAQIFYAIQNHTAAPDTVTVTYSGSTTACNAVIVEYSGINVGSPFDVAQSGTGNSTSLDTGLATPTYANELIFGAGAAAAGTVSAGGAFGSIQASGGNITEDSVLISNAQQHATASSSSSGNWVMQMAVFRDAHNAWSGAQSLSFGGPAPWYDVTTYGAIPYSVAIAQESTTATATGGSPNVTLAAAKNFQNGEGVVIYQGGAATTQTTPSAPTVTSPAVTGSRIFHYQCAGIDSLGGLTAASASGSVSSAPAVFGNPQIMISSISLTSNVVTVIFSSPINATGGNVQHVSISGVTGPGASWNGYWLIATAPTSSKITYALTASNGTGTVNASSLGQLTNTAGITAISRSTSGIITVTTDAAHNFLASGTNQPTLAIINGVTPLDFLGTYAVLTASGTTMTLQSAISPAATETGTVTTGFSTATVWEYTTVTCPAISAPTVNYAVYGDSVTGSLAYLGETMYGQRTFTDWGPFYASSPQQRGYVPSTPPSSAQNSIFRGTIATGGGTTSLVLTGNVTSTVTSQTIVHDESQGIQSALNAASANGGGAVYLSPMANQFCQYAVNYPVSIPQDVSLIVGATIIGNEPFTRQGANSINTLLSGCAVTQLQFGSKLYQTWQGHAKEFLHGGPNDQGDTVDGILFNSFFNGQNFLVFDGGGGYDEVKNIFCNASNTTGGTDVCITYIGNTAGMSSHHLQNLGSLLYGPLGQGGSAGTQTGIMPFGPMLIPAIWIRGSDAGGAQLLAGQFTMDGRNTINGRGILYDETFCSNCTAGHFRIYNDWNQGPTQPMLSFYGNDGGLTVSDVVLSEISMDSSQIACLGNWAQMSSPTVIDNCVPSGGASVITGNLVPQLSVYGLPTNNSVGQNTSYISFPVAGHGNLEIQTPKFSLDSSGDEKVTTLNQNTAGTFAGTSSCVSSTKAFTFATAYLNTPAIIVSDETSAGGARVSAASTTGFTVTCSGASDTFDYVVVGNPN